MGFRAWYHLEWPPGYFLIQYRRTMLTGENAAAAAELELFGLAAILAITALTAIDGAGLSCEWDDGSKRTESPVYDGVLLTSGVLAFATYFGYDFGNRARIGSAALALWTVVQAEEDHLQCQKILEDSWVSSSGQRLHCLYILLPKENKKLFICHSCLPLPRVLSVAFSVRCMHTRRPRLLRAMTCSSRRWTMQAMSMQRVHTS